MFRGRCESTLSTPVARPADAGHQRGAFFAGKDVGHGGVVLPGSLPPPPRSCRPVDRGIRRAVALAEVLPAKKIAFAFVFGSVAADTERAESDLDLMIVGSARHRDLASALRAAGERIGREINPHFFEPAELARRVKANDRFLNDVMAKPKLFIIGDENKFTHLVGRGLAPTA